MGVKNLMKLIRTYAPDAVKEVKLADMAGWRIGVDASIEIYRHHSAAGLTTAAGAPSGHMSGLFYSAAKLLRAGIQLTYVFDGEPPAAKAATLADRKERRAADGSAGVNGEMHKDAARLLEAMGIRVVWAPGEADSQLAQMCKAGLIDAVMTRDLDILPHGGNLMLPPAAKDRAVTIIRHDDLVRELAITEAQFIDLCIMLGCDYSTGMRGVALGGLALIKEHGSIEGIIAAKPKLSVPHLEEARAEFLRPRVDNLAILQPPPLFDPAGVLAILAGKYEMSAARVEKITSALV